MRIVLSYNSLVQTHNGQILTFKVVLFHKMYKYRLTSLNPVSPSAQHACVKSAQNMSTSNRRKRTYLPSAPFSCPWCSRVAESHSGMFVVLTGATETVKCWQATSSILPNAHCYFVSVGGGWEEGQSAHPKSEWDTLGRRGGGEKKKKKKLNLALCPRGIISSNQSVPKSHGSFVITDRARLHFRLPNLI